MCVLGSSDTIDEILQENGIRKTFNPLDISENEEGKIKALKFLFNKYGQPRN